MKSKEPFPNPKEFASSALWTKKEGMLSLLALQDFGKFLMGRPEHRAGTMTCLQMSIEEPLEVRFFGDSPDSDDVFHITQDSKAKGFRVSILCGDGKKINALLEEFGFVRSDNPT